MKDFVTSPLLAAVVTGLAIGATVAAMVARELGARSGLVRPVLTVSLSSTAALLLLIGVRFYVLAH